ncbi:hypothetical protein [Botrimarina mediterranea]|uniref:hypothetical protein n=1 Tax=Botrimarina mediterranea TaxID=2528022 RepID=UPI0011AA6D90|nr:hypothetical protein [Botrimarina mediterranea]
MWRVALLWGLVVLASFAAIAVYAKTPGRQQPPSAENQSLPPEGRWRIAMAIHPRCPCSKASIAHLQRLLHRYEQRLSVDVYVYRPGATAPQWANSSLVEQVKRLPSLEVHDDVDGAAALGFGIETSGGLVLYSPEGPAVFYGGITPSRGHEGANDGLTAVIDAINGRPTARRRHPVYGCPIFRSGDGS